MLKKLSSFGLSLIFLVIVHQAIASEPAITGELEGLELCPEFQCGSAYFIGKFRGKINDQRAKGGFVVSIDHEPLPAPGQFARITGGEWTLRGNLRVFSGKIVSGTIYNNGDDTFAIEAVLRVTSHGRGPINVSAELDHNEFPPTVTGQLSQPHLE